MSHYCAIVFSHTPDEVDDLLAPYCECVEAGSPYAVFVKDPDADVDRFTKKRGYWHNPDGKWDWYALGNRWKGTLKLKPGKSGEYGPLNKYDDPSELRPGYCDRALASDLDFSRDEEAYKTALRRWEALVEGAKVEKTDGDMPISPYKPEYYINEYGSKEFYAECGSMFVPYAFITADGKWHAGGNVGWFGMDDSTVEKKRKYREEFYEYLKTACEQGLIASMIDLHT